MNTALGLRRRNALHPMDSAFVFQLRVHPLALDDGNHFLQAADSRFRFRKDLHFPAMLFSETRVHAEDLRYEERSLVSTSAGTDLQNDVLLVVGILGQEH